MDLDSEWVDSIGISLFLSKFFWPNGVLRRFTLTPFRLTADKWVDASASTHIATFQ
jgi:hypothetical protein